MANNEKNTQVNQNLVYLKEMKALVENKKIDELFKSAKALRERLSKINLPKKEKVVEAKENNIASNAFSSKNVESENIKAVVENNSVSKTSKVSSDSASSSSNANTADKADRFSTNKNYKDNGLANRDREGSNNRFAGRRDYQQNYDKQRNGGYNNQGNNYNSNYNNRNGNVNRNYGDANGGNRRTFNNSNSTQSGFNNRRDFSNNANGVRRPFGDGNRQDFNKKPFNKSLNDFKRSAQNAPMQVNIEKESHKFINKPKSNGNVKHFEDGKQINKKRMSSANLDYDDERQYIRKLKVKKEKQSVNVMSAPITKAVLTSDHITVKDLSEKIGKTVADIIKKLFILGNMATINSTIDFDTAELVSNDLGVELELKAEKSAEQLFDDCVHNVDDEKDLVRRPPIITVMGHVDHGKTSLLDAIRKTNVVSGEAGGITQHIGAYTIKKDGKLITFIDTPGHAAFTAMRARGAMVTDIAVLVVAADDGIMPQTVEAINHIKAAKVPMIVAINKIDKQTAQIDRIKQQLAENDVLPEEWGGDAILVPVSAKTGEGIDKLLETMLLVAEVEDLKANPNRSATGVIIEAKLDRGRGPVATVLVQNGTLKIGNTVVCGTCYGKIRAMIDDNGKNVVSVGPSIAVAVLGFDEVPNAGDTVQVVDEKLSKQIIQERKVKEQINMISKSGGASIEDFMSSNAEMKTLNIILKADVQGSVEAIKQSLITIKNDEAKVSIIHFGVGNITETDILLAQASHAIVIAFNVKCEGKVSKLAEKSGVEIKSYSIIYDILDDINRSIKGMQKPKFREVVTGHAEIRMVYKITGVGLVAGSYVKDGSIKRNSKARILRGKDVIATCNIDSVKVFKDDVKEVTEGFECGIKLSDTSFKENDIIEAFIEEEIKE